LKAGLIDALEAGRAREAELVRLIREDPPDLDGEYTPKDHLAHLSWWRARNARLLEGVRTGGELPPSVEDDAQNAKIYAEYRDKSAELIREEARASWDQLILAVHQSSEELLERAHPYAPDTKLWQTVPPNGHGHLAEHLLMYYQAIGDQRAAEGVRTWAERLDRMTQPTR
jgi:hypothetical protein